MPATERSPLLASRDAAEDTDENSPLLESEPEDAENEPPEEPSPSKPKKARWPSIIAMLSLAALVGAIITFGFLAPPAIQKYVEGSAVLEPTGLSVESITPEGIRARVQANFRLDGSRVQDENARRIGRFATSIMRKIETLETKLNVFVPDYGNALMGSCVVPPISLDLVDGHNTEIDFVADFNPGDAESLRTIINDWLQGKLDRIKVTGSTALSLKTGFLPLGTHDVVESMVFEASQIPDIPEYDIQRLEFRDVPAGEDARNGIGARVRVAVQNDFPVSMTIPSLGFKLFVSNCNPHEPLIKVATAVSRVIKVVANETVSADATGLIERIPESLTRACPDSELSPLDLFVKRYLKGDDATVFVQGDMGTSDLPSWVGSFIENVTVPIAFPGQNLDDLIRNLTLTDVDFQLPSPFADPDDPDSNPRVSGIVQVLVELPEGFNMGIGINELRSFGELFYLGNKFGELKLDKWQPAQSSRLAEDLNLLKITSKVKNAPIEITDSKVFTDVLQKMLFGDGKDIILDVLASVDAKINTAAGTLIVREVPAKGKVPLNGLPGSPFSSVHPRVGEISIKTTTTTTILVEAKVNVTNPTPYTADIPYASVHLVSDGHVLGIVSVEGLQMQRGNITNISASMLWDPIGHGGPGAQDEAKLLLSKYLSGENTTIAVRTHRGSLPGMPDIGEALSRLNITFPMPAMDLPEDDEDSGGDSIGHGFIRDAVFHFFSSAATFRLASPLHHNAIFIEELNATAFYNHTELVGKIYYNESIEVPPGITETPYLPVDWDLDSVGFDKLRDAIGGTLRLDAEANVTIRIGDWVECLAYHGEGIGARVGW